MTKRRDFFAKCKVYNGEKKEARRMAYEETPQEFVEQYYFVPDAFDLKSGIYPLKAGRNRAKPNYQSGWRMIDYYSLHFVREGSVLLQEGGRETELGAGDIFCLFPQRICSYARIDSPEPLKMTWVAFDGAQAAELLAMIPLTPERPFAKSKLTAEVRQLLQQLLQFGMKQSRPAKAARFGLLYQLFSELARTEEEQRAEQRGPEEWIRAGMEYMKTHYGEPIGVRHAAEHVNIHRAHFTKLFTEHVGMSPSDYLRRLRMEQALRLLRGTSRSIHDIALSVGYADTASFSRAFRTVYGTSPSACRRDSPPAIGRRAVP